MKFIIIIIIFIVTIIIIIVIIIITSKTIINAKYFIQQNNLQVHMCFNCLEILAINRDIWQQSSIKF